MYNAKVRFFSDAKCELTASEFPVFRDENDKVIHKQRALSARQISHEIESLDCFLKDSADSEARQAVEAMKARFESDLQIAIDRAAERKRSDSIKRAKDSLFEIAYANSEDWRYMITLTLDKSKIERNDPAAVLKPLQNWLKNNAKRKGLKALVIPELHADGAIHFHGLVNDALCVVDSGTVKIPDRKKPVKRATAKRYGVADGDMTTVYNCSDWRLGFSTFVPLNGDIERICGYVAKYITKDFQKIFGKSYFAVGDVKRKVDFSLFGIEFDELLLGGGEVDRFKVYETPRGRIAYLSGSQTDVLSQVEGLAV